MIRKAVGLLTTGAPGLLVVTLGATLTVGCSSGDQPQRAGSSATHAAASGQPSTAVASSAAGGPTLNQWASFIASNETPVVNADAAMDRCSLAADWRGCTMTAFTFALAAETLGLRIQIAERPGAELSGPLPLDIARLVPRTKAAIADMNAANAAQKDCLGSESTSCMQAYLDWDQAHDQLMVTLNGWKPFIGS